MAVPPAVAEAFRLLQAGDVRGALEATQRALAADPSNARAHLASGIALRMAGRLAEARAAFERAQQLDPRDPAASYEAGVVAQLDGDAVGALAAFERSARARPDFFAAHFAAGLLLAGQRQWAEAATRFRRVLELRPGEPQAQLQLALALASDNRHDEAEMAFAQAQASHPADGAIARAFGQYRASRGDFEGAAALFSRAHQLLPGDAALPMYLAQCELLGGRWAPGWAAYNAREPRRQFEHAAKARGKPYALQSLAHLRGREVTIVGEQGLGDTLFFLRWAPALREAGVRLRFAGDSRLHSLLARTGLFEELDTMQVTAENPLLAGDLPQLFGDADPTQVPSLGIPPIAARVARWRTTLEAVGPRPWIGASWRAGTGPQDQPHALSKRVPAESLFGALAAIPGTLVSLQRAVRGDEIEVAGRAAGRKVHDLARVHDDLEDVLALVTLLDRHVAVSSTTMHLAAAAGATADVLVPFPPEWRWRSQGDSPWFPGFRVHRQRVDASWSPAVEEAARGLQSGALQ